MTTDPPPTHRADPCVMHLKFTITGPGCAVLHFDQSTQAPTHGPRHASWSLSTGLAFAPRATYLIHAHSPLFLVVILLPPSLSMLQLTPLFKWCFFQLSHSFFLISPPRSRKIRRAPPQPPVYCHHGRRPICDILIEKLLPSPSKRRFYRLLPLPHIKFRSSLTIPSNMTLRE